MLRTNLFHGKHIVDRLDLKRHNENEAYLVLIVSSYFVGVTTEDAS